jgi:hypothetical protein
MSKHTFKRGVGSTGNLELVCFESENLISRPDAQPKGRLRPRRGAANSPESRALLDEIDSFRATKPQPNRARHCPFFSRLIAAPMGRPTVTPIPRCFPRLPRGTVWLNRRLRTVCERSNRTAGSAAKSTWVPMARRSSATTQPCERGNAPRSGPTTGAGVMRGAFRISDFVASHLLLFAAGQSATVSGLFRTAAGLAVPATRAPLRARCAKQ